MIPTTLRAAFDRAILPLVVTILAIVLMASVTVVGLTAVSAAGGPLEQSGPDRSAIEQSGPDQPTVDVATTALAEGEEATVAVTLSSAPAGLSGYKLDLAVADGSVATIDAASYPDRFGLTTEPTIGEDGRTITLEAADLDGEIEPGATNVTLARVIVSGVGPGAATLSVEPIQFDGDDGSRIAPIPRPGVVTVGSTDGGSPTQSPVGTEPADGGDRTDAGGPADPADTATATTTTADGSLATLPLFVGAALVLVGRLALRTRRE